MSKTPLIEIQSKAKMLLGSTESAIRKFAKSVGARRYDDYHQREALKAVGAIERYWSAPFE
jgi:hypothetical protein